MRGGCRRATVLWLIGLLLPVICGAQVLRDGFDYA